MSSPEDAMRDAINALNNGKAPDAERLFKKVLELQPKHVGALNLLTIALMSMNRFAEAEEFIAEAVRLNQQSDISYYNYGLISQKLNKPKQALECLNNALRLNPSVPETWNNRGTVYNDLKDYERAISDFDKAISLASNYAEAFGNKGGVLSELSRHDEALAAYDKALAIHPDFVEAWLGRGNTLNALKRYDEAVQVFNKALAAVPQLAEAALGLGNAFAGLKQYREALAAFDKALTIKPDLAEAWLGRGNVLSDLSSYDEALAAYNRAIEILPGLANAWLGRGNVLTDLRRHDEALKDYEKVYALTPDLPGFEGILLHSKMNVCDWKNFSSESSHLIASARKGIECAEPFGLFGIEFSPKEQNDYAKLWVQKKYPRSENALWKGEVYKHDRIRIGYLSTDLRSHPVGYLIAGVLERHDRARFDVTGFSIGVNDNSDMRRRLEGAFDQFIDARLFKSDELAARIREAEIDILIDMNGLTRECRTDVLARRPAPIQVNYLGYAGTMGADYVDYIIADPTLVPAQHLDDYTEKVVYLPHTYLPHDESSRIIANRSIGRSEYGLPENGFVFCCFNNAYKLNPKIFATWMGLLKAVDGSVLWLSNFSITALANLQNEAASAGVDPERLIFAKRVSSSAEHLARHRLADLFLDTLPYNAHTTASDALWAGLPVLTQIGETFAGRVAASLLNAIDVPELIADGHDAYKSKALELALKPEKLAAIKAKIDRHRLTTPLFDTQQYTRHIESAYAAMYARYRNGLAPDHIRVSA